MSGSRLPHDSGAMGTHIVILGGGTGGTLTANRLRRMYDENGCRITVVDQDDDHVYQPGLLFVPFGAAQPNHLVRHMDDPRRPRRRHRRRPPPAGGRGTDRSRLGEKVFTSCDLPGAVGLHHALERFEGGRVVVNLADLPIKCPVAPLQFVFLVDRYFQRRGIRDKVQLAYTTPLDGAFTETVAAEALGGLLAAKSIELVTEFTLGKVDGAGGRLVSYDEREVPFDLAVACRRPIRASRVTTSSSRDTRVRSPAASGRRGRPPPPRAAGPLPRDRPDRGQGGR